MTRWHQRSLFLLYWLRAPHLGWWLHRCHWRRASPPLPPRAARCRPFPCCWRTCCVCVCPRLWVWRLATAARLHSAEAGWALRGAWVCRNSYLQEKELEDLVLKWDVKVKTQSSPSGCHNVYGSSTPYIWDKVRKTNVLHCLVFKNILPLQKD